MTTTLAPVRVQSVDGVPGLEWAVGRDVSIPLEIAERLAGFHGGKISISSPIDPGREDIVDDVRLHAAFTTVRPASSRLPFSYQRVPLRVRTAIGHVLGRWHSRRVNSWAAFPRWPLDLSADFVADLCSGRPSPFAGGATPVLLSHDIDTADGLRNLVDMFISIEESVGAISANYIVPCAWPIDHALLEELVARRHELGIHGYDHSNWTPYADPPERKRRIEGARHLVERYGMTGYRAPSLVRTRQLLDDLGVLYKYDSSMPTSGGLFPAPNNGCATARPFRVGQLIEIPLSMPRDGSLAFLGHSPEEILAIWLECAERISASGGVVTLLTHCEERFSGNPEMLVIYRGLLEALACDSRFTFSTSADVLQRVYGTSLQL